MSTQLVNIGRRQKATPPPAIMRAARMLGGASGPLMIDTTRIDRPLRRERRAAERAARKAAR